MPRRRTLAPVPEAVKVVSAVSVTPASANKPPPLIRVIPRLAPKDNEPVARR